ncbi:MAG TPA: response regulator transcription factor [Drouetiella sp.]
MKVLIVEDDLRIAKPLQEELQQQRLVVNIATDGLEGWEMHLLQPYDLILLDLMLPKLSGVELCRRLRKTGFSGSILMLTAMGEKQDRIHGLDCGADDYVVKPFDLDELNARIRALLRRGTADTATLTVGKLAIDTRACSVAYNEIPISFTATEYRILVHFVRHQNAIFSKHELIDRLWSFDETPSDAVIKTHIKSLRQKMVAAGCNTDLISTVYGFGYKFNEQFE